MTRLVYLSLGLLFCALTIGAAADAGEKVEERGGLESADTLELCSPVARQTAILNIVPEGSLVKKGDLLIELDASPLCDELAKQQVMLAKLRGTLERSKKTLAYAREAAKAQMAAAELAVRVAELDQQRYVGEGGEYEFQLKSVETQIAFAEQKLQIAQAVLDRAERAFEGGTVPDTHMEQARLSVAEARAALETARAAKRLLTEHTRNYRTAVLELAVLGAKSTLLQNRFQLEEAIGKAEAECQACKSALELAESKCERLQEQIRACQIIAPRDGLVVYASTPNVPGAMVIQEGAMVRERQTLVRMPDMDRLQIRVHLDKSDVQRIRKGQPVVVRMDAFPDQTLSGEVAEISDKPDRTSWYGTEDKYSVVVSIKNPGLPLRLGMTASVEFELSDADR